MTLLEANAGTRPILNDGLTVFHATHHTLAAVGAPTGDAPLTAARVTLRKQTGLARGVVSVTPRFLIVPPDLEVVAEKWLSTIVPGTAGDVNVHSGRLILIIEPRLRSTTRWYIVADPIERDGLEYAYLFGAEGAMVDSQPSRDIDGGDVTVKMDFGCGFVDHRGWYANAGA